MTDKNENEHAHTNSCILIEIRGVYDGALFYQCDDSEYRHRFKEGDYRYKAAEGIMENWRKARADADP